MLSFPTTQAAENVVEPRHPGDPDWPLPEDVDHGEDPHDVGDEPGNAPDDGVDRLVGGNFVAVLRLKNVKNNIVNK